MESLSRLFRYKTCILLYKITRFIGSGEVSDLSMFGDPVEYLSVEDSRECRMRVAVWSVMRCNSDLHKLSISFNNQRSTDTS